MAAIVAFAATTVGVQIGTQEPAAAVDLLEYCDQHPGNWWGYRYEACAEQDVYIVLINAQTLQQTGTVTFHITRRLWLNDGLMRFAETVTVSRKSYTNSGSTVLHDVDMGCSGQCIVDSADAVGLTPPGITSSGTWYYRSTLGANWHTTLHTNMSLEISAPNTIPDSVTWRSPDVRCDTLTYIQGEGCVFPWAIPIASWSTGQGFDDIINHIAYAQGVRGLPGRPGTTPLHRTTDPLTQTANRNIACPSSFPTGTGQSCDEYPFASTSEGAASGIGYSARAVDAVQNYTHGGHLSTFLARQRVIHGDAYWVTVSGATIVSSYPIGGGSGSGGGGSSGGTVSKAEPALVRDNGDSTMKIWRWKSDGSSFDRTNDLQSGAFRLSQVENRVASGDVDGDGDDDIVMAYQNNDGTFSFHVFKNGNSWAGIWYTSGPFSLGPVDGRLVVGDFGGDNKEEPALVRDNGDGTMKIWRWTSDGNSFNQSTHYQSGPFHLGNVADRVAAGDADGDGKDDIVMAYQKPDGTFGFYVFKSGLSASVWYTSGQFHLGPVGNRMVMGDFGGDSKEEPALVRDNGDGTMKIWRWTSDGNSFNGAADYDSGSFHLSAVEDRVAAGDVDGDGKDDIVMAYQKSDGTFSFHVFDAGASWAGVWYTSGQYHLGPVAGRITVGRW